MKPDELIIPDWPAPPNVHALVTTRAVAENRRRLRTHLPAEPVWLTQVHGTRCLDAARADPNEEADAACTSVPGVVCAVLTADCLPVLLCDDAGTVVAVAHAGWRGLAAGVIEATVRSMGLPGERLMAWLGPAIGPQSFEVGDEVRAAFAAHDAAAEAAFAARPNGKWLCDIYRLARQRLAELGVRRVAGGDFCTVREADRFFSYRRDGATGRMASLIWMEKNAH